MAADDAQSTIQNINVVTVYFGDEMRPGIYTRSVIIQDSPALSKDQFYGITQIHVHMVSYTVSYTCISAIQKHAM